MGDEVTGESIQRSDGRRSKEQVAIEGCAAKIPVRYIQDTITSPKTPDRQSPAQPSGPNQKQTDRWHPS